MIEAANKQIKYNFLYHKHIATLTELKTYVHQAIDDYNNRPHNVLSGLTPNEVLKGKMPANVDYAAQLNAAKARRLTENKKLKCCSYSF